VTDLSPEICRKAKEARRTAGLSQSVLAAEVGCKQSALSMFEQGDGTKLNDEVIGKILKKFSIELPKAESSASAAAAPAVPAPRRFAPHTAFCPNPHCPSHCSYEVDGRVFLSPDSVRQDPVGGKFCAVCGELLERRCPNCGSPVHVGAVCSFCGEPYVALAN
jgi:DNA-binding XRE family transcriptional regulator